MPGILYHLSFAEEVYRNLIPKSQLNKIDFMSGNLIPDLAVDKKIHITEKKLRWRGSLFQIWNV